MKKSSCACTLIIQLSLCLAIYVFLNLGQPQRFLQQRIALNKGESLDLFFISVSGGFRPILLQTYLLKLMEKVARAYDVGFVVNISEFGDNDPLMQNATQQFASLKIPWYSNGASRGKGFGYYTENIKLPRGKSLDLILVNCALQQDILLKRSSRGIKINNQIDWLTRTLDGSNSDWSVIVASDPLIDVEQNAEQKEANQVCRLLHKILIKYGVNVYLSNKECTVSTNQDSVACVRVPGPIENKHAGALSNEVSDFKREIADGFLLHRVDSLEFVTYFVNLSGEIIGRSVFKHYGKDVM